MIAAWPYRKAGRIVFISLVCCVLWIMKQDHDVSFEELYVNPKDALMKESLEEPFKDLEECPPEYKSPKPKGQKRLPDAVIIGVKKVTVRQR